VPNRGPRAEASIADAPPAGPPGPGRWRTGIAVGIGLALLGAFIATSDLRHVGDCFRLLGWTAPAILVPESLVLLIDTWGWRGLIPAAVRGRIPLASLYLTRMAGEAVNGITPAATVGGEPVKAHLLRAFGMSGPEAMASVVLARTALTLSQAIFVAAGATTLLVHLGRAGLAAVWIIPQIALLAAFALALIRVQQRGLATAAWHILHRVAPRSRLVARLEDSAATLDRRLDDFHRLERSTLVRATGWHLVAWLVGTTEVLGIMWLIDAPVDFHTAFLIESLGQVIRAASLVIPGALGVQEWGGMWLTTLFGVAEPQAVTLWLLKRGRETVFDLVGLGYLARRTYFAR
jgi:putative membrane protein